MARRTHRKQRKSRKSRKLYARRGGGWGFTGSSSIPGTPGIVSNPVVFTAIGDCRAAEPGYQIPTSSYGRFQGLPGMNGGKRKGSRKQKKQTKRRQKGGRYTFDLSSANDVAPNGAAWWAGTYPPVQRIACEGSTPNPLNPGPHTPSTQPTPVAPPPRPWAGGGQNMAPATVGVGNVDSMYYYGPTAGYDNKPSTWVDSVGAPVQLQIPYAARAMNPACLTTGSPTPLTGALQQQGGRRRRSRRGGYLAIGAPPNNISPNSSVVGNVMTPNSVNSPVVPNIVMNNNGNSNLGIEELNVEEVENVPAVLPPPTNKSFLNRTRNTLSGALSSLKNIWESRTGGRRKTQRRNRRSNRR